MRSQAIEIAWHEESSVWSVDCAPVGRRIVTAGADKFARVWRVADDVYPRLGSPVTVMKHVAGTTDSQAGPAVAQRRKATLPVTPPPVVWMSDLTAHTTTVNVARFAPDGVRIATGADVVVWRLDGAGPESAGTAPTGLSGAADENTPRERWVSMHTFRGHSADVLDVSWSVDGHRLASASVDNSIRVWDSCNPRRQLSVLWQDGCLIQGVAFDPTNSFIASLRSDRTLVVHHATGYKQTGVSLATVSEPKSHYFASDIKCNTVFRRLAWSPDGSCLACPSGMQVPATEKPTLFAVHIFARGRWSAPVLQCSGLKKLPTSVAFCPALFKLRAAPTPALDVNSGEKCDGQPVDDAARRVFCLPYRMLFAIACPDSVLIYDTESWTRPIARVAGIHFSEITDVAWSADGSYLAVSSTDSSVSIIAFEEGELGEPLAADKMPQWMKSGNGKSETSADGATCQSGDLLASGFAGPPTSKLEPVTPITVVPRRKTDDVFISNVDNLKIVGSQILPTSAMHGDSTASTQTRVAGHVDTSGVREVFVVVPRRKQPSDDNHSRACIAPDDPARKRLRMDDES
jgi:chromatin assembly factor 1 subunit B